MTTLVFLSTFCALFAANPIDGGDVEMTPERMLTTIDEVGKEVEQDGNVVQFLYEGVPITLMFDPNADRMRLLSPVIEVANLKDDMLIKAMQANYHGVLDVRYAIANGVVWSAFVHPMSDLSEDLLRSAIRQVAIARVTFGGAYTSGEMIFGGGDLIDEEPLDPGDGPPPVDPRDRPI